MPLLTMTTLFLFIYIQNNNYMFSLTASLGEEEISNDSNLIRNQLSIADKDTISKCPSDVADQTSNDPHNSISLQESMLFIFLH